MTDFEVLVRQALAPVEPPAELEERLERGLAEAWSAAQEELDAWEVNALLSPRGWVRPVVAAGVGSAAAVGLVLVRTQRSRHRRRAEADNLLELAGSTVRDLARETGRLIDDVQKRR